MRTIKLKSLSLVNFKGVRSFDVSFDSDVVTITGGNATGKTTLYDAYLWLLFGKDSAGRGMVTGALMSRPSTRTENLSIVWNTP